MTPKEKAQHLVDRFEQFDFVDGRLYAEIAVDEILNIDKLIASHFDYKKYFNANNEFKSYWLEVKKEIEKL